MKIFTSILFTIVFNSFLFNKLSERFYVKEPKIKIINYTIDKNPNKLPILNFTILNSTKDNIIINKLRLNLHYFKKHPLSSSSNNKLESKELKPIGSWDLNLPTEINNAYLYTPKYPIEITSKDAVTIQIRVFLNVKGKNLVPSQFGSFKFNLAFLTYDNIQIQSEEILLGD